MKKYIIYSILIHFFIINWIVTFIKTPATALDKANESRKFEKEKIRYERKTITKLDDQLKEIREIKNEMVRIRNKKIEQLLEFEECMHEQLPGKLKQSFENNLNTQNFLIQQTKEITGNLDHLQKLQNELEEISANEDFQRSIPKADSIADLLSEIRTHLNVSVDESHYAAKNFEDLKNLSSWLDNDLLRQQVNMAQEKQESVNEVLRRNQNEINKYQSNVEKSRARLHKNVSNWDNSSQKSFFKKWQIRNNIRGITKKNRHLEQLNTSLESQYQSNKLLNEIMEMYEKTAEQEKFYSTNLKEINQDTLKADKHTKVSDACKTVNELQREIDRVYHEVRAAELAIITETTFKSVFDQFADSLNNLQVYDDYTFPETVTDEEQFESYKKTVDKINREINDAFASVHQKNKVLAAMQTSRSEKGVNAQMDGLATQVANFRNLRRLSQENTGPVQDLSGAMRNAIYTNFTSEQNRSGNPPGSTSIWGGNPPSLNTFTNISGQKITSYGRGATWFYIGNWYIIGPFPNRRRENINKPFPPEAVIDLDAAYTGKDGKPVKWLYVSSPSCLIIPPQYDEYAIFYAYTEIYSDRPRDIWMALGSDDRSDMWINELPVWKSSNQLKPWRIDEGFRKVFIQQGHNKIMVRIENGWRECCFSLILSTQPS
ncbi:hypothetical protein JXQ31_21070 [candidate division KSB1 bacterium]|nr:hypothetical protein [candidate division KSB1 bacterium]